MGQSEGVGPDGSGMGDTPLVAAPTDAKPAACAAATSVHVLPGVRVVSSLAPTLYAFEQLAHTPHCAASALAAAVYAPATSWASVLSTTMSYSSQDEPCVLTNFRRPCMDAATSMRTGQNTGGRRRL